MYRTRAAIWIMLVGAVLSAPLATAILMPQSGAVLDDEMRLRATFPAFPFSAREWRAFPGKIDSYFRDHFGMRKQFIHIHALLAHRLLQAGNALVEIGNDDWFFLRSDNMLQQSAGLVVREQRVIETAETIAEVRDRLTGKGICFIFASPPNSATIYPDMLPEWARNPGNRTEYDLILDALVRRGVQAVDLRPPLRSARAEGAVYYQHDTHWSARGAIVGFNSVASASGHADWRLRPSVVLGPAIQRVGGDLARMLDIANDVSEWTEPLQSAPNLSDVSQGPSVLAIGDLFTAGFAPLLLANSARFTWIHHDFCGFDWSRIEQIHPDEVWWMPTERYILCNNVKPKNMPNPSKPAKSPLLIVAN